MQVKIKIVYWLSYVNPYLQPLHVHDSKEILVSQCLVSDLHHIVTRWVYFMQCTNNI